MEKPDDINDDPDTRSALRFVFIAVLGIVFLNLAVFGLNTLFPGNMDGAGDWAFVEIIIVIVAVVFAHDLNTEKQEGRSRWRYILVYPAIWLALGYAAYLFHSAFIG
mgnify:CR=1